jgi:hypothetical protein
MVLTYRRQELLLERLVANPLGRHAKLVLGSPADFVTKLAVIDSTALGG